MRSKPYNKLEIGKYYLATYAAESSMMLVKVINVQQDLIRVLVIKDWEQQQGVRNWTNEEHIVQMLEFIKEIKEYKVPLYALMESAPDDI